MEALFVLEICLGKRVKFTDSGLAFPENGLKVFLP